MTAVQQICTNCGLPAHKHHIYCQRCLSKKRQTTAARTARRDAAGLCARCGKGQKLLGGMVVRECLVCFFKRHARVAMGSEGRWRELVRLYLAQGGRCWFSGRKLTLGWNASLDHLIPKSRRRDLSRDVNNLAWCLYSLNLAKGVKTEGEFVRSFLKTAAAFCQKNGLEVLWPS